MFKIGLRENFSKVTETLKITETLKNDLKYFQQLNTDKNVESTRFQDP